jgi:hypothetical protein
MWNIHDLTAFEKRRPKYTRSWQEKVTLILLTLYTVEKEEERREECWFQSRSYDLG